MALDLKDSRRFRVFALIWLLPAYGLLCSLTLSAENAMFPGKFDGWLHRVDLSLGLTAFPVARLAAAPPLHATLYWIYIGLIPAIPLWYAVESHLSWEGPSILWAFALDFPLGALLYAVVPACGPIYAFRGFPFSDPATVYAPAVFSGYPNAMPSIHVASALLFLLFSRSRVWKCIAVLFLTGTVLATLGLGQHYVIDLIVAAPYACLVHSCIHRKVRAAAFYGFLVLAWLAAIRFFAPAVVDHETALRLAALFTVIAASRYVGMVAMPVRLKQLQSVLPMQIALHLRDLRRREYAIVEDDFSNACVEKFGTVKRLVKESTVCVSKVLSSDGAGRIDRAIDPEA